MYPVKIELKSRVEWRDENGELHRVDGPAIEWLNGDIEWWLNGLRHRGDGPAIELYDGAKQWWSYGSLHRIDGPAAEWDDGDRVWYLNGVYYANKADWFKELTKEDQISYLFKMEL